MHANLAIKIHSRVCFPDFLSQLIVFNAERATPIRPTLTPPRCLTAITTTTVVSIQTAVVDGSRERTDTGGEQRDKLRERRDIIKEQRDTAKPTPSDVAVTIIRLIADREIVVSRFAITIPAAKYSYRAAHPHYTASRQSLRSPAYLCRSPLPGACPSPCPSTPCPSRWGLRRYFAVGAFFRSSL